MEKKIFNPNDWLEMPKQIDLNTESIIINTPTDEIESLIQQIEWNKVDIATSYSNWLEIGFALADELKEQGRNYFHRISAFYPDYNQEECNAQFDSCLNSNGNGITIKTLFYHAKQAGIKLSPIQNKVEPQEMEEVNVPNLPDELFPQLPNFLQRITKIAVSKEERDILLLGSLVTISACFPKLYGIYDGRKVFPNLYLFVTAQASAGKGRLVHCKQLVKKVHLDQREQAKFLKQQHEIELTEYNSKKGKEEGVEKPGKPPEKMLFIPANNSTTGVFQLLADNEGRGLIFETEGDTLAQAFKTDYGNYSDGFRKAFHHETISYYRRTDREYVDIENPCLSTVLSGTPKQIAALIPNAENGLFSRFMFYFMKVHPIWKDVFLDTTANGLDGYFDDLGNEFYEFYKVLIHNTEIQFCLTVDQQEQFNNYFTQIQEQYLVLQGLDYMATIRRLGLITFRMCMLLSVMRIMETGEINPKICCQERDFQTALAIVKVLVKHSSKVFAELPEEVKMVKKSNRKEKFLLTLPKTFNRQQYLEVARQLSITDKTAEAYITEFCKKGLLHREHQDHYINNAI
jgi:hypothetical protein